jgi:hypothetical protein
MRYLLKNLCYIFIFISLVNCSNDNEIPEEIIPPVPVRESSYVLAVKNGSTESFLLDKNGEVVFNWTFDSNLGNDLELLPDGKLIGMFKTTTPSFFFGGYGGIIRILNVDGSINWEYEYFSENYLAHHDVELLPNGHVLFIAWERITAATAKEAGVDTEFDIYPEVLIEVDPDTDEIVWEWHSFDHIIQDRFLNKPLFGDLGDNPQLIDINYALRDNGDIMHANGIDYDRSKDVIYLSVNFYSEVWVIDHSTTKEEARASSGGNFGKGGDLIYRFGNPGAYNNPEGQRLFYNNHFPNFLQNGEPGAGNVLIFVNKDKNANQSAVYELIMPDIFNLTPNTNNEPEIEWSFTDTELFYQRISGAVRLKNGNTLICEGDFGFWEVATGGEIVWKYDGNGQGDFWRAYAYGIDSPEVKSLGL